MQIKYKERADIEVSTMRNQFITEKRRMLEEIHELQTSKSQMQVKYKKYIA